MSQYCLRVTSTPEKLKEKEEGNPLVHWYYIGKHVFVKDEFVLFCTDDIGSEHLMKAAKCCLAIKARLLEGEVAMVRRGNASELIGKTIKDVIVVNRLEGKPRRQVFILFDDNTHYEFYGEDISATGGVDEGGKNEILDYVRNSGAYVTRLIA